LYERCAQPAQQHGRRIPPFIFEIPFSIRIPRVSAFLPEVTQQIHSLCASGVMSCHKASTLCTEAIASRRSLGSLCTVPPAIFCPAMHLSYCEFLYESIGQTCTRIAWHAGSHADAEWNL